MKTKTKAPATVAERSARFHAKQQAAAERDGFQDKILPNGRTLSARSQALAAWVKGEKVLK